MTADTGTILRQGRLLSRCRRGRLPVPLVSVAVFAGLLAGCVPYADFTLPPLIESPREAGLAWETLPSPVIVRGAPGEWDANDALNPVVVRRGPVYYNFYSGYDGRRWRTGLATSYDGVHWQKHGPVLEPDPRGWEGRYIAANGSALLVGREFFYWYQAGDPPRIGLATSPDGRQWVKRPAPVLGPGPRGAWDERGVADPYVVQFGSQFYLFYLGQDRARRQRLGVACSPDGIRWRKLRANPVLELGEPGAFDENGLGEPAVWASHGWYWMLYTGRDRREYRRLGLARSRDGLRWERVSTRSVFEGRRPWASRVVCDPWVEMRPDGLWVWFGGGDVAAPAENLNGQIGLAQVRFGP